jgi:hypothetical protein
MAQSPVASPRFPRFFAPRAVVRALAMGSVAVLLLLMAHSSASGPVAVLRERSPWVILFVVLWASALCLWGFWSWPRVWARTEGPNVRRLRIASYGWGAFMLVFTSWNAALGDTAIPWTTSVQSRDFLANMVSQAMIVWPVWLWAGYWFGYFTVGVISQIAP